MDRYRKESFDKIILIFLVIFAALLRLHTLDANINGDEAATFLVHCLYPWRKLLLTYQDTTQHTLFVALARFFMAIFGESETVFRLPSLLAGVLSVPLAYWLGLRLLGSRTAAIIACGLLVLSFPQLSYSQDGRGYSLTAFLALVTMLCAVRLTGDGNRKLWGAILTASGFGLVYLLPSNIHFLVAAAVFFLIATIQNRPRFSIRALFKDSMPFCFAMSLVLGYFILIYPELRRAVSSYQEYVLTYEKTDILVITPERVWDVVEFMVSPWSPGLYVVAAYGWVCLWRDGRLLPFMAIFITPLILIFITKIMGPPRAYIYWLPFVLMSVAVGAERLALVIKSFLSGKLYVLLFTLLGVAMLVNPVMRLVEYYPQRLKGENSSMRDARKALEYVAGIPKNHLVVVPYTDRVLRHYLDRQVAINMLNVLNGEPLEKIIFLGRADLPPQNIPFAGFSRTKQSPLREDSFKTAQKFGGLNVYEFRVKIARLLPPAFDPDYEASQDFNTHPDMEVHHVALPRIVGEKALVIQKKGRGDGVVPARFSKIVDIENDGYLLFVYAERYRQSSNAFIIHDEKVPAVSAYLNYYLGVFHSDGKTLEWRQMHPYFMYLKANESIPTPTNFSWQISFFVTAINKGQHKLVESLNIGSDVSYFDGMQTFILANKDNEGKKE